MAGQLGEVKAIPDIANHAGGLTSGDTFHKVAGSDPAAASSFAAVPAATQMQPKSNTKSTLASNAPGQHLSGVLISNTAAGDLGMSHRAKGMQLPTASPATQQPLESQTQQVKPSPEAVARMQQQAILESSRHLIGLLTPDSPSSSSQPSGGDISNLAHVAHPAGTGADVSMAASQQKKRKASDAAGKALAALFPSSP